MEPASSSQSDKPHEHPHKALANLVGTVIAFMTLIIPVISIAYFSSSSTDAWQPATYQFTRQRE
jgi:hypothetical protein